MLKEKKVKGIIFDKDGTLIDFDSFWIPTAEKATEEIINVFFAHDIDINTFMLAMGVKEGVCDIEGVLCKGTYKDICDTYFDVLERHGYVVDKNLLYETIVITYEKSTRFGCIKPACKNLKETLTYLKNKGIRLAVATTDNEKITNECLEFLGIIDCFDKIYTDNGSIPTKPNSEIAKDFLNLVNVSEMELLMVGDTLTDIKFASNSNIEIMCVAKTKENKNILRRYTDNVYDDVSVLRELI